MTKEKYSVIKEIKFCELFSGIGSQIKALKNLNKLDEFKNIKLTSTDICEWSIQAMLVYYIINHINIKSTIIDFKTSNYKDEIKLKIKKIKENNKDIFQMGKDELLQELQKYTLSNNFKDPIEYNTLKKYSQEILQWIYLCKIKTNNHIDINKLKAIDLNKDIDIMTYSFPCQDLSVMGHFHGYNKGIDRHANTRSGLLWQVERILLDMKDKNIDLPKILVMENVTTLLSCRHKENFEEWQNQLEKYYNKLYKLNAYNLNWPQRRTRFIMISVLLDNKCTKEKVEEYFKEKNLDDKEYIKKINSRYNFKKQSLKKFLKLDCDIKNSHVYFDEAKMSQPNDTPSRRDIWNENIKLVDENNKCKDFCNTITTKQDRHPNAGNIYFEYTDNKKSKFRYLTPRECFLLMGFEEIDFEKIFVFNEVLEEGYKNSFLTNATLLHLAGNSIVVKMLEYAFLQCFELLEIQEKNKK